MTKKIRISHTDTAMAADYVYPPTPRKKFVAIWPKTRVVRRFVDHGTYSAYLETVQHSGALISWPSSHVARCQLPA